jgi:hypothetical protein
MGKIVKPNTCPHCGATKRDGHKQLKTEDTTVCARCDGSSSITEERTDWLPKELWQGLPFRVIRSLREQSWAERFLGVGCYSCEDYGRAWGMTDGDVVKEVREHGSVQACKILASTPESNEVVADEIVIDLCPGGYRVVPFWRVG